MSTMFTATRYTRFNRLIATAAFVLALPSVHAAGVLEQILNNPQVQALIGVPANVTSALNLCSNPAYKAANAQTCANADNASMVLKLPFEMRTVMSSPSSAKSLRDLCLGVQASPLRDSYLCAELIKADSTFAASAANERARTLTNNNNNGLPEPRN